MMTNGVDWRSDVRSDTMEVATRRVHFAGCTTNPDAAWMEQTAQESTNLEDGFLNGKLHVRSRQRNQMAAVVITSRAPNVAETHGHDPGRHVPVADGFDHPPRVGTEEMAACSIAVWAIGISGPEERVEVNADDGQICLSWDMGRLRPHAHHQA